MFSKEPAETHLQPQRQRARPSVLRGKSRQTGNEKRYPGNDRQDNAQQAYCDASPSNDLEPQGTLLLKSSLRIVH
jgi:hypothetical protein